MLAKRFLSDRVALVTGASRGIGAATAVALAAAGAHVILTARTEGGLTATDDAIAAAAGTATIAPLDLADGEGTARLGAAILARWGRLDIAILNAATLGTLTPVAHADPAEVSRVFGTNVLSAQRMIAALDPALRAAPAARVIGLTSGVSIRPRAYWGMYAASKAAFDSLMLCYAAEIANVSAVRVALVNPGATATAMRARAYPGEDATMLKPPSVVADAIVAALARDFETGARIEL